jgi:hypothetical protein
MGAVLPQPLIISIRGTRSSRDFPYYLNRSSYSNEVLVSTGIIRFWLRFVPAWLVHRPLIRRRVYVAQLPHP